MLSENPVSNHRTQTSSPSEGNRRHTAFALTNSAVNDGGKFTKQFFRGTRATSAVEEGFLGAILRRCSTEQKSERNMRRRHDTNSARHLRCFPPDSAMNKCAPEPLRRAGPPCTFRTEACSGPLHVTTIYSPLGPGTIGASLSRRDAFPAPKVARGSHRRSSLEPPSFSPTRPTCPPARTPAVSPSRRSVGTSD